ncbi:MAG: sensor histidine kinase [Flavisolibacter sp.]
MLQDGGRFPSHQYEHFVFGSKVSLMFITYEPVPEAHDIFKRLGKVFEQTYTRFLDLQKAEAQARESQIELGLERVRARAMAMQTSEELNPLIGTVFTELTKLDLLLTRCVILIYEGNEKGVRWWMANSEAPSTPMNFFVKYADMPFFNEYFDGWQNRSLKWQYCLEGENKIETDDFLFTKTELSLLPDFVIAGMRAPDRVYLNASFNNFGNLTLASLGPLSEEHFNILLRFAKVFDLTYTRFNDLQKAEAQAREAQIELALERVRARTMAMQKSDELAEAAQLLYHEFGTLGINTITCGYMFIDEEKNIQTAWTALPDGTLLPNFIDFPLTGDHVLNKRYEDWKQKKPLHIFEIQGEVNKEHHRFLSNYVPPFVVKDIFSQLPDKIVFHCANFSNGYLLILATDYFSPGDQQTIIRFAKVFEMTYRRFLDLEQAEAQAREAQIEAALERVRSKAMAMHNSADLSSAASVVFTELKRLGIKTIRSGISLQNKENRENLLYTSTSTETEDNLSLVGWAVLDDHPVLKEIYDSWVRGEDYFPVLKGDVLKSYYEKIKLTFKVPAAQSQDYEQYGYFMAFTQGMFYGWAEKPFDNNEKNILKRFASVVDLTFKRYFDLQKAESQAREAQFELALERVRARTMAMQKSDELRDAVLVIYEQLQQLNFESKACNIIIIDKKSGSAQYWVSGFSQEIFPESYTVPYFNHPYQDALLKPWKRGDKYVVYEYTGQIKKSFDEIFFTQTEFRNVPEDAKKVMVGLESVMLSTAFMSYGALQALGAEPLSEEKANILKRFAKVFEQTYTRFLDLQKAEAQAREAQIETSLERVRSKTMAMHSSDDVTSATATMFTELGRLGIENMRCGIAHYLEDHKMEVWSVSNLVDGKVVRGAGLLDTNSIPFWKIFYSTWRKKEDFLYYLMAGKEKEEYFKKISTLQNYLSQSIEDVPDLSIQTYYFPEGSVWAFSLNPHSEEDKQVMKRFASVFSLTFRRYQDLQKAEAQTREATIEAALEKVRGKAMAMHNSNDLSVTASLVFTELRKLGINPIRCGVGLLNKESQKAQLYSATSSADGDSLSLIGWVILAGHPVLEKIYETWLHNEEYYPQLQDEQLRSYYQLLLRGLPVTMPDIDAGKKQYGHFLPFSIGCLYAWSDHPHNESEIKILRRFATIIDLTFRRYLELQKAEANAREAVKQAAVDRIRADIASMRTIGDLDRITPLIWNELTILGIPFIRCGVFIMDDSQQLIHTFLSTPDGKAIAAFHLPYTTPGNIQKVISHWHDDKNYIDHWDESDFTQFAEMLVQQKALSSAKEYLRTIPHEGFYLHFLPFLQGMLYVGNTTQLGDEEIDLIQHVADAFSTAYARYEDFNKLEAAKQQVEKTLTDLKQAQTQLVQSEKMASLGELTAGIAHEIQNPLNFVNNFSEVSNELIDEMKEELARGNVEDAIAIAEDVKQNLEKINHHGKRADGIVKGMLQHSRTSSGQKEMTDINVLADEYLRLAYHGLRAKEKSFNAKFETDFDKSIEKINIIPQEIGRVILNLINNAFYAVSERKKHDQNGYEPTVILTTVKNNGKIEIEVKDNGNGIPQKVIDKIFQPFFTTKPTGQGTGLGLSLAYDIIKAHGGEIKVQTKEEEGSKFIIQLPA